MGRVAELDETEIPAADLQSHLREIFGERTRLTGIVRVNEGIGKKTYLLDCEPPGSRCILYIFVAPETGLTEIRSPHDSVIFPRGAREFVANTELLVAKGVNVPRIYLTDTSRAEHSFDFAFVEYIDGNTMADVHDSQDSRVSGSLLEQVHQKMLKMHALTRKHLGSVMAHSASQVSCEDVVSDHSLQGLDLAAQYNSEIQRNQGRIREVLEGLRAKVELRSSHHFIHGELGPEHIMVDRTGKVYFIDIEGAAFFDLEY